MAGLMSIMMMDLDDFKKVNDPYGHLVGNFLLKEVAQILKNSVRLMDILGRYGGDEFLVIFPETPLEGAKAVGERIAKNIREHRFVSGKITITMTVSMGLCVFEDSGEMDSQSLIEKADQALLEAKRKGKDFLFVSKSG